MRRILSGVRALRQRPMKLLDSRQSCDVIGHCLKVMTPDKIRSIGRIFDIGDVIKKKLIFSSQIILLNFLLNLLIQKLYFGPVRSLPIKR